MRSLNAFVLLSIHAGGLRVEWGPSRFRDGNPIHRDYRDLQVRGRITHGGSESDRLSIPRRRG